MLTIIVQFREKDLPFSRNWILVSYSSSIALNFFRISWRLILWPSRLISFLLWEIHSLHIAFYLKYFKTQNTHKLFTVYYILPFRKTCLEKKTYIDYALPVQSSLWWLQLKRWIGNSKPIFPFLWEYVYSKHEDVFSFLRQRDLMTWHVSSTQLTRYAS